MLTVSVRGAVKLMRDLQRFETQNKKSLERSIRVEAFRLRAQMQKEIKAGAPGGRPFDRLTFMARRRRGRKSWLPDKPLGRLGNFIRYDVKSTNPFVVGIGWTQRTPKGLRNIAERQQVGFTSPVSDLRERFFRHRGGEVSKLSDRRRFFFLRKATARFTTPARPIIDPFWDAHRSEAVRNIRNNFRLKMMGRRI